MSKFRKSNEPVLTRYTVKTEAAHGFQPIHAALISDLHDRPCDDVIAALRAEKPDIILAAGDLMECYMPDDIEIRLADLDEQSLDDSRIKKAIYRLFVRADMLFTGKNEPYDEGNTSALTLLRESARLAPTFYALGNHERYMPDKTRRAVAETGAALLENASIRIKIRGAEVLVGGIGARVDHEWLNSFSNESTDGYKLLICHRPEYYDKLLCGDKACVVFSGHAHGGQFKLFGKPFFAPGQGIFPEYTGGVYHNRLVVGRGLSNTAHIPRFGNPTELVIVSLVPQD